MQAGRNSIADAQDVPLIRTKPSIQHFNQLSLQNNRPILWTQTPIKHVEAETKWTPFSKRHFQMHFLEWKFLMKISLKIVLKGPINNIPIDNNPSLVHIMAWSRLGDKPLSEPMMVSLLAHVCVTRSQWVLCLLSIVSQTMWPYNGYSLHVDNKKCYSISVVISHIKSI